MTSEDRKTIIRNVIVSGLEVNEKIYGNRLDIIAFDLDGTLLPSALETPSKPGTTIEDYFFKNQDLVKEFQEALDKILDQNPGNVNLVVATGRGLDFAKRVWNSLTQGKEKYKIKAISLETGTLISLDGWDNITVSPKLDQKGLVTISNLKIKKTLDDFAFDLGSAKEDKDIALCYNPPLLKNGERMPIENFHKLLKEKVAEMAIPGVDVEITSSNSIEIFPKGASKSTSLEFIFDNLSSNEKYSSLSTIFCCDSLNDIHALNKINIMASPSNSNPLIKEHNDRKFGYYSKSADLKGTIENLKNIALDLQEYREKNIKTNRILQD